jgi:hypothetical protein
MLSIFWEFSAKYGKLKHILFRLGLKKISPGPDNPKKLEPGPCGKHSDLDPPAS